MTKRNKLIEFKKDKLESLKYSGKTEWYFAENFEGLCIRVLKTKKTYYSHWSIPKIKDGKIVRVGIKKKIGDYDLPLAEVKAIARQVLDKWKKQSITVSNSLTVDGLARSFVKNGARGQRIKTRGIRLNYKPKTSLGYVQMLTAYVLLEGKHAAEMQKKMSEPIRINGGYETGALKDIALDKVSRRDIEIFMKRLEDKPAAANHALAALSVAFEWDMAKTREEDKLYKGTNNPCIRVAKYAVEKNKDFLDIEKVLEIRNYIINEQWRDPHFFTYYALLVECGERQSDLRGIYWSKPHNLKQEIKNGCTGWIYKKYDAEIATEITYIHIIDSKNRKPADIDITDEAAQLLQKLDEMRSDKLSWCITSKFIFAVKPRPQSENISECITENSYRWKMERFHHKFGLATRDLIRSRGKMKKYKYRNIYTLKHLRKTFATHYGREHGLEATTQRLRQSSQKVTSDHYFNYDKDKIKVRHMYSPKRERSAVKPRAVTGGKK